MAQQLTRLALLDGAVGVVVAPLGRLVRVLRFTIANGRIAEIDIIADPASLAALDVSTVD
jgi:RNA polymerase sigma-70 factor (ECF subfamily)